MSGEITRDEIDAAGPSGFCEGHGTVSEATAYAAVLAARRLAWRRPGDSKARIANDLMAEGVPREAAVRGTGMVLEALVFLHNLNVVEVADG